MKAETAIDIFKENCEFDAIDEHSFDNPDFLEKIQDKLDDFEDETPSDDQVAQIVEDTLRFVQYGDTDDVDDLTKIHDDYSNRFPDGR